ncbi:MAG: MBL fold metallo-hydrolase [Pseudomonadota bacterium]
MPAPRIKAFFDTVTNTVSYVVQDPEGNECAIIDPVLDYDPKAARTHTASADKIAHYIESEGLKVAWILETHAHADHLSGAPYLQQLFGGHIAIGAHIKDVQAIFKKLFNLGGMRADGSQFDHLFKDGESFHIGGLKARVLHTPGHTPACLTYVAGDAAFVGDTLFMPDYGTARADFPGGDARILYRSIRKILETLPPETRLFMCHDYKAPGREEFAWESTVAEERASNVHVRDGVSEEDFVRLRRERDKSLAPPMLLLPAIQINMRAGRFPEPEANGVSYLKIPLNQI